MDEEQVGENIENGLSLVCDECDHVGSAEAEYPSWQLQNDGRVLCIHCADKQAE